MAKRKHSTALFEVITTPSRRTERPLGRPSMPLRIPKWWGRGNDDAAPDFASRAAGLAEVAAPIAIPVRADPHDPTANVTAATLLAVRVAPPITATSTEIEPATAGSSVHEVDVFESLHGDVGVIASSAREDDGVSRPPSRSGMQVAFDADRQEVTLRMRYTSAIVSAFGVLVVIGLAYVVGRHVSEGPQAARASPVAAAQQGGSTSAQVRNGPVQVSALAPADARGARVGTGAGAPTMAARESAVFMDAPVAADGSARRTTNMNYVIVVNYPPESQKLALEVRDFLTKNGIRCTVEKGQVRATGDRNWYSVVGTRGFPPKYGALQEYQAYMKGILALSTRAPDKSQFGKFQPMPYKWLD